MRDVFSIRRLRADDLRAYKAMRDEMLRAYPEAFTSDAQSEGHRRAEDYLPRLGLERAEGGHLTLGAWHGAELVGAIGIERDPRPKVHHIGHIVGMMVRDAAQRQGVGAALIDALIEAARSARLELLTLTVTEGNDSAIGLYERAGFERFGRLPNAIKVDERYHAKLYMVKTL